MAPSPADSGPAGEDRIQRAFEEAVEGMELGLEDPSETSEMARAVGVAFALFSKTVDVETAEPVTDLAVGADDEIERLIKGWEALDPDEFAKSWKEYATDPYIGVGKGWAGTVDDKAVQQWLESEQLAAAKKEFPPHTPRQVSIENLKVVYLGAARAAATYRVEEEHANGKLSAGNEAVILVNVRGKGWRIIVATKGGR